MVQHHTLIHVEQSRCHHAEMHIEKANFQALGIQHLRQLLLLEQMATADILWMEKVEVYSGPSVSSCHKNWLES